ncbi:MAG: hypothetical protein NBV67_08915 [Tagaea sp.]|nr:hypothetical protein [Tagaea sp.]
MIRAALLFVCLALAACGPIPRPFQPDEKDARANPLLRLTDQGGVVVPPVAGLPEGEGRALAEAIAEALRGHDIPANTRAGNRESLILDLRAAPEPGGRVGVDAQLVDPQGVALQEGRHVDVAPRERETAAEWAGLAKRVAAAVAAAIKPETLAQRDKLPVRLAIPKGAPGDGGIALMRALAFHLERMGVRLTDDANAPALGVTGDVGIGPAPMIQGAEARRVSVVWRVADPAGGELGRIDMANAVPLRAVDRQWAELSFEIAAASAEAIRELVERFRAAPAR